MFPHRGLELTVVPQFERRNNDSRLNVNRLYILAVWVFH